MDDDFKWGMIAIVLVVFLITCGVSFENYLQLKYPAKVCEIKK